MTMMQSTHHSSSSHSTSDMMAPSQSRATDSSTNIIDPDVKILQDLLTLSEQIALCQSMLANRGQNDSDNSEALLTVIGFLEACAPRMLELIEIAAQGGGALKDETFEECLVVNDKLTSVLADLDNPNPSKYQYNRDDGGTGDGGATTATSSTSTAAGKSVGGLSTSDDADDIDLSMQTLTMGWGEAGGGTGRSEVVGGKTTGLDDSEDLLGIGLDNQKLPSSASSAPPSATFPSDSTTKKEAQDASSDNDDFDSFFKDRTSAP
jgi:hypothetical protein